MRVLITGGAGFIGSHLADAYLARGDEVFVLDDLSTGSIDNIRHLRANPRFHYTIESVHHAPTVAELVDQCDVVFHLAAAVGVRLIVESPVRTIETNVHGTEVVLAQANKKKKKVLIASTSEVYGLSTQVPFREDGNLVLGPDLEGALELRLLEGDRRVPGPGLLARAQAADGDRPPVQHGRPAPDRAVRHGRPDVRQAGPDRPADHDLTATASQSRCFADVSDVVGALMALMDHPAAVGEVFNIGSNEEVTIRALAERVKALTGFGLRDRAGPVRTGLRRRLRGHAAPRARYQQDRQADRLPSDASRSIRSSRA